MAVATNFKTINTREGHNRVHFYNLVDLCLYKKNGGGQDKNGKSIQYLKCISDDCPVKAKISDGQIIQCSKNRKLPKHNHRNHNRKAEFEKVLYFILLIEHVTKKSF